MHSSIARTSLLCALLAPIISGCTTSVRAALVPTVDTRGAAGFVVTIGAGFGLTGSFERRAKEEEMSGVLLLGADGGGGMELKGSATANLLVSEGIEYARVARRLRWVGFRGGVFVTERVDSTGHDMLFGGGLRATFPVTVYTGTSNHSPIIGIGPTFQASALGDKDAFGQFGAGLAFDWYDIGWWGVY